MFATWLDSPPPPYETTVHGVVTMCRCGARVEASAPDQLRAMLAGHWLFDADHERFVAAEAVAR